MKTVPRWYGFVLLAAVKGTLSGWQIVHWWWRTRSRSQPRSNGFFRKS